MPDPGIRRRLRAAAASPLAWVLALAGISFIVGIGWGLPASDGWDNDGVAPRDYLVVLSQLFSSGPYDFAFLHLAPVHALLLGLLTWPIALTAVAKANSLAPPDVIHEIVKIPYMTAIALIARVVNAGMSVGIVYATAKIGDRIGGRRVAVCVASVCGVNSVLAYYAHTTNLDVPGLFWGSWALFALVSAIACREPRRLRHVALLAVMAIGTKDQSAGLFILGVPLALAVWFAVDAWAQANARLIAKEMGVAAGLAVGLFLIVDFVLLNPKGFRARVAFLLGPASHDHAEYSSDARGRFLVVEDTIGHFSRYYPWVFGLLVLLGLGLVAARMRKERLAAGLVPLLAAISFTLIINCIALRTEARFLLPQMVLVSVYAGIAVEWLASALQGRRRSLVYAALAVAFGWAVFLCVGVDVNLLFDTRYDVEAWMRKNMAAGDLVEVHGNNVYLPRFPSDLHVVRVGPEPTAGRSPLPGIEERQDAYSHLYDRKPRWLVVSEGFVWQFLDDPTAYDQSGRIVPRAHAASREDADATWLFRGLFAGERGYRQAYVAAWDSAIWPPLDIHASTTRIIRIFERE